MLRFRDALTVGVGIVRKHVDATIGIIVVRDPSGFLSVVVPDDALPMANLKALAEELNEKLTPYSPGVSRVALFQKDLIDREDLLESPDLVRVSGQKNTFLLDRLLTNQDWIRKARKTTRSVPTAAAYSIKGGVGRSTGLCVLAWHLARQGRDVVVLDLDLEAPGIGTMLLREFPRRGIVDWFVESLVGQANEELLDDALAIAPLSEGLPGSIRVGPAFGSDTEDYVPKLGRVYMPSPLGDRLTDFSSRLDDLICAIEKSEQRPDVILLDSRAGLHDIGAAAVTQVGAEVLMFARNDMQTWESYKQLFGHLGQSQNVKWGMPEDDIRWRIKMVAAQIDPIEGALRKFTDASYATWSDLYDAEEERADGTAQVFSLTDETAPHFPLRIAFGSELRGINFVDASERLDWAVAEAAFGSFLSGTTERLFESESATNK